MASETEPQGSRVPRGTTAQVNFRAGELQDDLEARTRPTGGGLAVTAKRDLERYYYMLRAQTPTLTRAEWCLTIDALNGTLMEPHTMKYVWADVEDAIGDGYANKWGVDGVKLVAFLRALTPFQQLAVVDVAERFWTHVASHPGEDFTHSERLRALGLAPTEFDA